jgi:cardiolipin synthase
MAPTLVSKLNTLAQILLGLVVVFSAGVYSLPAALIDGLVWLVLASTLVSGADYVWTWGTRAARARSGSR